jgi:hypothetical protein
VSHGWARVRTSPTLGRHSSAIRAACANERSCGSARGAISDGRPYRDLKTPLCSSKRSIKRDVKKKASPRPEARFLSRDPAHWSITSLEKFGLLSILVSFPADGDGAIEFERAASDLVASEATMVLSEARGLWLFLVIREGIGCKWVTRCRGTQGRTVLTDTPLEPSISRTRLPTTGEIPRRWKACFTREASSCLPMQLFGVETHPFLPHG